MHAMWLRWLAGLVWRAWLAEKADLDAVAEELDARASQEEVRGLGLCHGVEGGGGLRLMYVRG